MDLLLVLFALAFALTVGVQLGYRACRWSTRVDHDIAAAHRHDDGGGTAG